jgi:hypothetical protein
VIERETLVGWIEILCTHTRIAVKVTLYWFSGLNRLIENRVARMASVSGLQSNVKLYLLLLSMPYTGRGERAAQVQRRREEAGVVRRDRGFINRSVSWELEHIPRGDKGSLQNSLRFSYNILRRKHIALGKSRHETLKELVEKIQQINPDFTPIYDKEAFKI